jgi:hypothetical protein
LAKADTRLWFSGSLAKNPKTKEPKLETRFRALVKANSQYYSPLAQISLAGMLGTLVEQANPTKATKASRGSG